MQRRRLLDVIAASLVAAINIDMPILLHDFKEVVALGGGHSTLGAAADRAARSLGLQTVPDPHPSRTASRAPTRTAS
jgi:hypothetical protein